MGPNWAEIATAVATAASAFVGVIALLRPREDPKVALVWFKGAPRGDPAPMLRLLVKRPESGSLVVDEIVAPKGWKFAEAKRKRGEGIASYGGDSGYETPNWRRSIKPSLWVGMDLHSGSETPEVQFWAQTPQGREAQSSKAVIRMRMTSSWISRRTARIPISKPI